MTCKDHLFQQVAMPAYINCKAANTTWRCLLAHQKRGALGPTKVTQSLPLAQIKFATRQNAATQMRSDTDMTSR